MSTRKLKNLTIVITALVLGGMLGLLCGCKGKGDAASPQEKACVDGKALERVLYIQRLYNLNPGKTITPQIKATIDSMRRDGRNPYYYAAVNVLIDRLFTEGRFAEADSLAVSMREEAIEDNDSLAIAMAKRVRAQMFYKVFVPKLAYSELSPAQHYIGNPHRSRSDFGTATSIQEWLWIVCRQLHDTVAMNDAGLKYARLVEENARLYKIEDPSNHYPVTALAFKAADAFTNNRIDDASRFIDSAAVMINPALPSRAYEHFYDVRSRVRAARHNWNGALDDVDTLLATHKDFPSFYLNDLLLKADILEEEGRYEDGIALLKEFIALRDSIVTDINVRRLKQLTVLHKAEIEKEQKKVRQTRLIALGAVTLLLLILLIAALAMTMKERRMNRLLVERLKEFDQSGISEAFAEDAQPDSSFRQMERLDRHMRVDRPYTDPSLGRKELAEFLGISQEALGKLIKEERMVSVKNYINAFRLDEARRVLGSDSSESISDLAARLGFGTARTLQRAFKERYAMSPTQYRDTARKLEKPD